MSYLEKMFTPEIKWQQGLTQDLKLKLSSMLSYTERETQRSEVSLEELQSMAGNLSKGFYEIHLLLKLYENELESLLAEVILKDSTVGKSLSETNIVH
jgi:hypothetical protein